MTDVQKLRALLDAAQVPGPAVVREAETWAYGGYALVAVVVFSGDIPLAACGNPDLPRSRNVGDLIAAAVNALPELLDEVERLKARIDAVGRVLSENGCDCDCGCFWDEHGDGCDRCLACRVEDAIARREDVVVEGEK